VRACAALLSFTLALSGCAGCYIDAVPQPFYSEPSMVLDCDPLLAAR
jgi:hypothetical protein